MITIFMMLYERMKFLRFCLAIIFLVCGMLPMSGQSISESTALKDSIAKSVYFDLHAISYFKNNEYTNDFTRGFTGIGYLAKPELSLYLTDKLRISGGALIQQYSGRDTLEMVLPVFRMQYAFDESLQLVLGNIYGNLNHGLKEALFRYDRLYTDNMEYGFQLLGKHDRYNFDLWLNWQEFIKPGDNFQEAFQIGLVSSVLIMNGNIRIRWPFQFLLHHRGGEIDVSPSPVSTEWNLYSGLRLEKSLSENAFIYFEPSYYIYSGNTLPASMLSSIAFSDGNAWSIEMGYQDSDWTASFSYWNADGFFAQGGESLYFSVSDYDEFFVDLSRSLIKAQIFWQNRISSEVNLELGLDAYYDTENDHLAHAFRIMLAIDTDILLKRMP